MAPGNDVPRRAAGQRVGQALSDPLVDPLEREAAERGISGNRESALGALPVAAVMRVAALREAGGGERREKLVDCDLDADATRHAQPHGAEGHVEIEVDVVVPRPAEVELR